MHTHTSLKTVTVVCFRFAHRQSNICSTFEHGVVVFRSDERRLHAHSHCVVDESMLARETTDRHSNFFFVEVTSLRPADPV